ncbi:hypothetical protein CGRA01v4_04693 [Colletotrichum graminicola]|nr:hypothetical protein CGRA01v4_04693 [Colletotrichum graminicola]
MWPKALKRRSGPSRDLVSQNQQRQRSGSQPCVCVYVCIFCVCRPCRPYPKGLPGGRYQNSV